MSTLAAVPAGATPVQTTAAQNQMWQDFLLALADQVELANGNMLDWYDTMRDGLAQLDVPFLQAAADYAGVPSNWTKELDQQLLDAHTMGQAVAQWLRDAASGKRTLMMQGDQWAIESFPYDPATGSGDPFRIDVDPQTHLPIMIANDQVPGTTHGVPGALGDAAPQFPLVVGAFAIPWVVVGLGMVLSAAIIGAIIYAVIKLMELLGTVCQGVFSYWNQKTWAECVQTQGADACAKVQAGMVAITQAENERKPASPGEDLSKGAKGIGDLATTLLLVAFGGAAIYLGVKTIPPLIEDLRARKPAHA